MSGRHEGRTLAVQFLFQRDFNSGDLKEALADFWLEHKAGPKVQKFADELILGVERERTELDRQLTHYAANWEVKRMGAVDRNVMRVALYEMNFCPDIPPVVPVQAGSNESTIDLKKGDAEQSTFLLREEQRRCQQLGQAAASDTDCMRVWAESRDRFLGRPPAPAVPTATWRADRRGESRTSSPPVSRRERRASRSPSRRERSQGRRRQSDDRRACPSPARATYTRAFPSPFPPRWHGSWWPLP